MRKWVRGERGKAALIDTGNVSGNYGDLIASDCREPLVASEFSFNPAHEALCLKIKGIVLSSVKW